MDGAFLGRFGFLMIRVAADISKEDSTDSTFFGQSSYLVTDDV